MMTVSQLQLPQPCKGVQAKPNDKFSGLSNVMILDTVSSIPATFMNPDFVRNIKTTDHPLTMSTNAGTKTMKVQGDVNGFGHVWFDPNQIANIFGFSNLADNHRIIYNLQRALPNPWRALILLYGMWTYGNYSYCICTVNQYP